MLRVGIIMPASHLFMTSLDDQSPTANGISSWQGHAWAIGGVVFATLFASPWRPTMAPVNIAMVFLLVVVLIAYARGRGPAITASVAGVASFDFFFVPPAFSFEVADAQYLLTFAVMLATGLAVAELASRLRGRAEEARRREQLAKRLYELARELSATSTNSGIADAVQRFYFRGFGADARLVLPDAQGELAAALEIGGPAMPIRLDIARAVFASEAITPAESDGRFYVPLRSTAQTRGVLVVAPAGGGTMAGSGYRELLATCAALIATALERVYFADSARDAQVHAETERVRSVLLSALSHDLRTPLTAILGAAEAMRLVDATWPTAHRQLIDGVREQAVRAGALVDNILDMARLKAGVQLRREWHAPTDIVESALRERAALLAKHHVVVELSPDLPLIECDAVLIERVLVNLLENAARHTPPGSRVSVTARIDADWLHIAVADNGPGIATGRDVQLFSGFGNDAAASTANRGTGLGLAICRTVIELHGGRIESGASPEGGARIAVALRRGKPPAMAEAAIEGSAA